MKKDIFKWCSSYTPRTLMTSAAADVISHKGRKIGRFKPIRFCCVRMTSAQSWSRRSHWFEPTSSLPIFKGLYLAIFKTLSLFFPVQLTECLEPYSCKIQAEICRFTRQNKRGLNRPILRPLWLMTSASADVFSVPSVRSSKIEITKRAYWRWRSSSIGRREYVL